MGPAHVDPVESARLIVHAYAERERRRHASARKLVLQLESRRGEDDADWSPRAVAFFVLLVLLVIGAGVWLINGL